MASECAIRCRTSADLDIKTVEARSYHEGLSFLTITLPELGKAIQKWLDLEQVDRMMVTNFSFHQGLPRFLGGFLDLVFDRSSGALLDNPNIDAILSLRQLTLMFGKILLPTTQARYEEAMQDFVGCEQEVRIGDATRSTIDLDRFRDMSTMLFGQLFTVLDREIYYGDALIPKHGPGATADRMIGNEKYNQRTWPKRLEKYFPAGEMLLPNWRYYDQLDEIDFLEPEAEIPTRVIAVPKTLKTPRIISAEPVAMQYCQQAVQLLIRDLVRVAGKHPDMRQSSYLSQMIGLDDQVPNQDLAQEGSFTGALATLDLSEASDRVSNQLVRAMLSNWPHLHGAVDACRSRKADVPTQSVIRLSKFAPMGSALCFPIEAMVFLTMIFIGIDSASNVPLSRKDVKSFAGKVRVFGDDIIVPKEYVHTVVRSLEHFGAKVNVNKSFWNGKFRESCGKEYYDGHDVSIVKVRREFPSSRQDANEVISLVALRNHLYWHGYWSTVKWLDSRIRKVLKYFPTVLPSSPLLGRESVLGFETQKMHPHLHSPLAKGYVVHSPIPENPLDDVGALTKFLIDQSGLPSADKRHLERSGRPSAVGIKLRNSSPI
jgi:hypothetical protein